MIRFALILTLLIPGAAFAKDSKEVSCKYQAEVVKAVQQARLDRVKEQNVKKTLLAAEPSWPENYNAAIPLLTPWVYQQKRKDLKTQDLGAAWLEVCLQQ